MNEAYFRAYIENSYLGSLAPKALGDLVSRCRRIEQSFGIDLEKVADLELLEDRLIEISQDKGVRRILLNALHRFADYRTATG